MLPFFFFLLGTSLATGGPTTIPRGEMEQNIASAPFTGNVVYDPAKSDENKPSTGFGSQYQLPIKSEFCQNVTKLVYEDKCIDYVEKTCYTQQKENCGTVPGRNCTGFIVSSDDRRCYNVTELICSLEETIDYEPVEEEFTVQKCTEVLGRVCDTVYDLAIHSTDEFQCLSLNTTVCNDEEILIKDVVCKYTIDFVCGQVRVQADGTLAQDDCSQNPVKSCYDVPRKVKRNSCSLRPSKVCEKLTNEVPVPVQKQACHGEPMKTCELETRTRTKKAKVFKYNKSCKEVPRTVCELCETKTLKEQCNVENHTSCDYTPVEQCQEAKKKYCYKAERQVTTTVCPEKRNTVSVKEYETNI